MAQWHSSPATPLAQPADAAEILVFRVRHRVLLGRWHAVAFIHNDYEHDPITIFAIVVAHGRIEDFDLFLFGPLVNCIANIVDRPVEGLDSSVRQCFSSFRCLKAYRQVVYRPS